MTTTTLAGRIWKNLSSINVNQHIQKKGNLTYLSWTWAWQTLMEEYPDSYYHFSTNKCDDGSIEVECVLSIHVGEDSVTRSMWLPVMDHRNKAIINPDARMISDAKMRCLVKCIAMFGLGHYIYAGEDIPSAEKEAMSDPIHPDKAIELQDMLTHSGSDVDRFLSFYEISDISKLPQGKYKQAYEMLAKKIAKMESETSLADSIANEDL